MSDTITFENISKYYQIPSIFPWKRSKQIQALNDINLTCPGKKITCLLGPNGAGKTTIIKILAGLVIPDSGLIKIFNMPISSKSRSNLNIGYVTQNERSFYWRLTGRQNLDFYGSLYNLTGRKRKQKITEILTEVDMEKEADKPFRLYSAGMRQKLHIARALLCDPDILLLDEPTTHIDPISQESINKLIKKELLKNRKTTILLCTHNLNEAQTLSDKIILLDKGSIIAQGDINFLRSMINSNVKISLEFSKIPQKGWERDLPVNILNQINSNIELSLNDIKTIPMLIKAAIKNGGEILECRKNEESLLEIFTRLTGGNPS